MSVTYSLVTKDGESNVVAFIPGRAPLVAHDSHPNFNSIVDALAEGIIVGADVEELVELFDVSVAVAKRLEPLSERVSVANGTVYLDGDAVHSTLTKHILRFLEDGVDDWKPLVRFFEKVQANPNEHSREQLYDWLDRRDFTIAPDGDIVAYKGVRPDLTSIHSGPAIVNGERVSGNVPNNLGSVIELDRSRITHDPSAGCAFGLHVGSYDYASSFGRGVVLEVRVNPRDVVSVPTDSDWAKVRVCRYKVVKAIDAAYEQAVLAADPDEGFEDEAW